MKTAAKDIKKLRLIQEALLLALRLNSWEEIPEIIKNDVTASNLARFMVSQLINNNENCIYIYILLRNDNLYSVYRCWNVPSVNPI